MSDRPAHPLPLEAARAQLAGVRFLLSDLDDTMTLHGSLPARSYEALFALREAGVAVVVVTGRPAGWCDMIARFWPVAAVVGENGAFYFRYDHAARRMIARFQRDDATRTHDRATLARLWSNLQAAHPHLKLAGDQPYRISDYAVDLCEDVPDVGEAMTREIVRHFEAGGATAKVSSIHVNAWIGTFSKRQMSYTLLAEEFGLSEAEARALCAYAGDSPNDEPMFEAFPLSFGVANIARFLPALACPPRFITQGEGGNGFAELAAAITKAKAVP